MTSAHTTHPNTPESDKEPEVLHDITGSVKGVKVTIQIMATDPLDAVKKWEAMSDQEIIARAINKENPDALQEI